MMGVVVFCMGCVTGFLMGIILSSMDGRDPPDDYLDGPFEQL